MQAEECPELKDAEIEDAQWSLYKTIKIGYTYGKEHIYEDGNYRQGCKDSR